jgi:rRNA small subunit pseudouridine methyltransferase Nep1
LLNADVHKSILRRNNRDIADYRPDITHQLLLTLLDSPLNKAGLLRVYIHTINKVLIEVNPRIRIPRTFQRFCGLMVQLLHKLKIKAADGSDVLMKVVKNPVERHLPIGCKRFSTSVSGELVNIREFVRTLPSEKPAVFVVGSQSHGDAVVDWTERTLSVSQYPLSAAGAAGRIVGAFEDLWGIL